MSTVPPLSKITLQQFHQNFLAATSQRDQAITARKDNMFKGPISLEEYIQFLFQDISMISIALQGLMEILVDAELAKQAVANDPR